MAQVTHFMYGTTSTYRADAFTSASATNVKEGQITAAIAAAVADGVQAVFVPQSMLPYNASLVTFNTAVRMIREGSNPAWWDIQAYGADPANSIVADASFTGAIAGIPATGGGLYVPPASVSYKTTQEILLSGKPITMFGDGFASKIVNAASGAPQNVVHVSGALAQYSTVKDLWLVTNNYNQAGGSGLVNSVVMIDGAPDTKVLYCKLDGGDLYGVQLYGTSQRCQIVGNVIVNTNPNTQETNASDIYATGGAQDDALISANYCLSTKKNNGIAIQPLNGTQSMNRMKIVQNTVQNAVLATNNGHGIILYATTGASAALNDCFIEGNICKDLPGMGIYIQGGDTDSPNHAIVGNLLVNCLTTGTGGTLGDGAITLLRSSHCSITGNVIRTGGANNSTSQAIRLQAGALDCTIVGNTIKTFTGDGIKLDDGGSAGGRPSRCTIVGNTIEAVNQGIHIVNGDFNRVAFNTVKSPLASCVLLETASCTDNLIEGNYSENCGQAAYRIAAAAVRTQMLNNKDTTSATLLSDAGANTCWRWAGRVTPTEAVLVSGVDASAGDGVVVTLTAARVVGAPLNPSAGQPLTFTFIQGGAGAWAVTWNAVFKKIWSDVGNATGARTSITFVYDGTNWNQQSGQALYV